MPHGPEDHGIEVVDVIQSLVENRGERYVVNVPNEGAIGNLPRETIVEVPAVVDAYGVRPVAVGDLHPALAVHLERHAAAQEATARAALSGDRADAICALELDPLVAATLEPSGARALLDELLAANAAHLPRFA
jgi:alpha-galactosidase/6-phospho-beta-glucosidase family protein